MKQATTTASKFIKLHRSRFFSLYPTDFEFLLTALTAGDEYRWENGFLKCRVDYSARASDITEDGWSSLSLAFSGRLPVSWPEPRENAPLFTVPEDIHDDWLVECESFLGDVARVKPEFYSQYIRGHYLGQMIGREYAEQAIDHTLEGFLGCVKMIRNFKIKDRLGRIRAERVAASRPTRSVEVAEGVTVRVLNFESTARVMGINQLRTGDGAILMCLLDHEIDGSVWWRKQDLRPVSDPIVGQELSDP